MIQRARGLTDPAEEIGWPTVKELFHQPTANQPKNIPKAVGDQEDETSDENGKLDLSSRDLGWEVNLL